MVRAARGFAVVLLLALSVGVPSPGGEAMLELEIASASDPARAASPLRLTFTLTNRASSDLAILSHVETTGGPHLDFLHVVLVSSTGESRRVGFAGARKAARRVGCLLPPGEALRHELDLAAWTTPLAAGEYELRAVYTVSADEAAGSADVWRTPGASAGCADEPPAATDWTSLRPWSGTIESAPIRLRVDG